MIHMKIQDEMRQKAFIKFADGCLGRNGGIQGLSLGGWNFAFRNSVLPRDHV